MIVRAARVVTPAGVHQTDVFVDAGRITPPASGLPEFPRADDLTLYQGMQEAARLALPVAVHAETNELIRRPTGPTVRDYLESRPILAEVTAVRRALALAEDARVKLHIVHVST